MQVDLTKEEITLIAQLFEQSNLSMNRSSMIAYCNLTNGILEKFKAALPVETPTEPKGE